MEPLSTEITSLLKALQARLNILYSERLVTLVLYGSHARQTASGDSDVDVLVVLRGELPYPGLEIDRMMDAIFDLTLQFEKTISVFPVSENAYLHRQSPLLTNIRREGVSV